MRLWEVNEHAQNALQNGKRYILVCYDVWDRQKGDEDGGYYYPQFKEAQDAATHLANYQLADSAPGNSGDVCEAVIDLTLVDGDVEKSDCQHPASWLAQTLRNLHN